MEKDFSKWNAEKSKIQGLESNVNFKEREIWWCALGKNIGFEQDGGKSSFARPVIIFKKFNLDTCLVLPVTSKIKSNKYQFLIEFTDGAAVSVILSQIRFVDRKRLSVKIGTLRKDVFCRLIQETIDICSPDRWI